MIKSNPRIEFAPMHGKKSPYIAHVSVGSQCTMHKRMIGRHIDYLSDQNKIRSGRHTVALQNGGFVLHSFFECVQTLRRLNIQRDFDDRGECVAEFGGVENSDLFGNDAERGESTNTA